MPMGNGRRRCSSRVTAHGPLSMLRISGCVSTTRRFKPSAELVEARETLDKAKTLSGIAGSGVDLEVDPAAVQKQKAKVVALEKAEATSWREVHKADHLHTHTHGAHSLC